MNFNSIQITPRPPIAIRAQTGTSHRRAMLGYAIGLAMLAALYMPIATQAQSQNRCDAEVVIAQGDTLSGLATRYLGSPAAYPAIVEATNQVAAADVRFTAIENPDTITPGWRICATLAVAEPAAPGAGGPLVTTEPIAPASPLPATVPDTVPDTVPAALTPAIADAEDEDDEDELPFGRPVVEGEPHPLSIEYLRAQSYPGSDIRIKQTLTAGSNYNRYVVSYLSEGLEIDAYMTVPTGPRPATGWPVVIFNHGYIPPEVYRSTERYIAYTDAFARAGYLVFRPDYRGHGFSQGEAGGAYSRPDYTIDVLNAVASVRRYADADVARIGMWGHSMGGYITLRAMVVDPEIKSGVIWAGVVASYADLLEHWRSRAPSTRPRGGGWRTTLNEEYGSPQENPEFWASISANTFLADLSGPLQIHHGSADTSVPLLFSEFLFNEVDAAERDAELYVYPGDDHNIGANLTLALQRSVAFFDQHVK